MFSRLVGGGKKKKKQSLQDLTTFMNPGKQRLRELKSIRQAALQRTLTSLQSNIKLRSQKLQPISEKYVAGIEKEDVYQSPIKLPTVKKTESEKLIGKKKTEEENLEEGEKSKDDDTEVKKDDDTALKKDDDTEVKKGDDDDAKKDEAENKITKEDGTEKKKPTSILDEPPKTRKKTDKEKRLEREAREKAEKEAKEREELEQLRAKWPIMKNVSKKKDSAPSGRLDDERWHNFLKEQFKILKLTPNVSITTIVHVLLYIYIPRTLLTTNTCITRYIGLLDTSQFRNCISRKRGV